MLMTGEPLSSLTCFGWNSEPIGREFHRALVERRDHYFFGRPI